MISITNFYNNITKYFELGKAIFIPHPFGCKNCGYQGRIHRHGYYQRYVITLYTIHRVYILRMWCPSCKKTYSILPKFLIPYYQYSFDTIFMCLYYLYTLNYSYAKVINIFHNSNPQCTLNITYLWNFKKRMKYYVPLSNLFFAHFEDFYFSMDEPSVNTILDKIKSFNESENHGDFNYTYFTTMPQYFFKNLNNTTP